MKSRSRKKRTSTPKPDFIVSAKAVCVEVTVDNPYFSREHSGERGNDKTIKAVVNMMESPAAHWFHKDLIDHSQYRAAVEFRRHWEQAGGRGAGAIDYTKEHVDGGFIADPIDERQIIAQKKLSEAQKALGKDYAIVRAICGQCLPLKDLFPSQYIQRVQSLRCRDALQDLARLWGYETRARARA